MKNLTVLLLLICSIVANGQLQQQTSFENPLPSGWQAWRNGPNAANKNYPPFALIEGSETWAMAIDNTRARSGTSSLRTELRPGDREVYYTSYRAEITMIPKGSAIATAANSFGISVYIPASAAPWVNMNQDRGIGMQSHPWLGSTTNGYPNWSIHIKAGRWQMYIVHTGANTANNATQTVLPPIDMGPVVYDVWTDWEVYCNNLKTTAGRLIANKVVNGVRTDNVCNYTGYVLHGFSEWPFVKMGTYDWNINSTSQGPIVSTPRIVYYDMARYGKATESTFSSVIGINPPVSQPANIPPTCSAGSNQSLPANTTQTSFSGIDGDADGTISSRQWAYVSGPAGSVITNGTTATPTVTMLQSGTYTYRYTVTDNRGATASSTVVVTVAAPNIPPTNSAGTNQTLPYNTTGTTLTGTSQDQDGSIIGHQWTKVSGPGSQIFGSANAATTTVGQLQAGTYVFSYKVTDDKGATATSTVGVTVDAYNAPPVLTPAPDTVIVNTMDSTTISCASFDPDGLIVLRKWVQTFGPTTAIIRTDNQASTIVANLAVGRYVFSHTATDNKGAATSATISVIVNVSPVVTIDTSLSTSFGKGIVNIPVNGSAIDPDGTVSSYAWSVLQGSGTFANDALANTVFTAAGEGDYILQLTVTDNHGGQSSAQYIFSIENGWMLQNRGHRKALPLH